ncbi:MAG: MarR family transcriptional regulator [Firmicutes bacterium]|nr:MarR family transcriptional regulator [Bacillota bacterium]
MPLELELNALLTDTFNLIVKCEEHSLRSAGSEDLSIGEIHLLETIAKNEPEQNTVSALAALTGVTLPSITVAIQKLEQKGYVEKIKSAQDARSVQISLTESGITVNERHESFHAHLIGKITAQLNPGEREVLLKSVAKINKYFKKLSEFMT